ncbi:MAG: hypothetical protein M1816_005541 [Peltula sp. TS41687]|nr:MAG: hypothetical protein M1816_005541 [Peltula sp. TS41687]
MHGRDYLWLLCFCLGLSLSPLPFTVAKDDPCPVNPYVVPLRNCTFESGAGSWGIQVELGTPGQRVCLVPSTVVNSTLLSQRSLCAISDPRLSQLECEALRGGLFNENKSTTWSEVPQSSFNSNRVDPTWQHFNPAGITKLGYDTLQFPGGDARALLGYGLALNQWGNQSNAGMLGLGVDSVFLDTALGMNITPSNSWSLTPGSQSLARPRNGEIVFGGYNQGKIDGSFRWRNVSDMAETDRPCPIRTNITDVYVTLGNGSQIPLISSLGRVAACIEPYDNFFRFTPEMLFRWKQITGYDPNAAAVYTVNNTQNLTYTELGLIYKASKAFNSSLTITLDNKYTTTLPSYELQTLLRGWNVLGERTQVPGLINVAILDKPTGDGEVPTLGKVSDYKEKRFGLAKAATEPNTDKLIPFHCGQEKPKDEVKPQSTRKGLDREAKIGLGVLAGVTGLPIIFAICVRVHGQRKNRPPQATPPNQRPSTLTGGHDGRGELDAVETERYELESGARGLGFNIAQRFAEVGAKGIVLMDINQELGDTAAAELHEKCLWMFATRRLPPPSSIDNGVETYGSVDVVVNSADIADSNIKAEDYSADAFRRLIDINLTGSFLVAQACARHMLLAGTGGSIIFIASMSGSIVNYPQEQCCYNASKARFRRALQGIVFNETANCLSLEAVDKAFVSHHKAFQFMEY